MPGLQKNNVIEFPIRNHRPPNPEAANDITYNLEYFLTPRTKISSQKFMLISNWLLVATEACAEHIALQTEASAIILGVSAAAFAQFILATMETVNAIETPGVTKNILSLPHKLITGALAAATAVGIGYVSSSSIDKRALYAAADEVAGFCLEQGDYDRTHLFSVGRHVNWSVPYAHYNLPITLKARKNSVSFTDEKRIGTFVIDIVINIGRDYWTGKEEWLSGSFNRTKFCPAPTQRRPTSNLG